MQNLTPKSTDTQILHPSRQIHNHKIAHFRLCRSLTLPISPPTAPAHSAGPINNCGIAGLLIFISLGTGRAGAKQLMLHRHCMPCLSGMVKPRTYCKPAVRNIASCPFCCLVRLASSVPKSASGALTEPDGQVRDVAGTSKNVMSGHFWAPTGRSWSGHALSSYRFSHPFFFVAPFFANRDPSDADLTTRMSKFCPKSTPPQPQHDFAVQKPRRPPPAVPFEAHFGASCRQLSPTLFEEKLHFFLMSSTLQSKCKTQNIL